MCKIVRLLLPGTVLVILVGAIAYGVPRKESFPSGRSESWFHRTFVTRRAKVHAQTQATSLPARDAQISFSYIGQDTKAGVAVQHIQISRILPGQTATTTSLIQRLSQVDIYLDS